jgi:small ligand-binding sensory domain FIST
MIQVGVGCSTEDNTMEAAAEASRLAMASAGIVRADFALVFTTPHQRDDYTGLIETVRETTGAPHLSGCSGAGVQTHQDEVDRGPGIAVMAVDSDVLHGYTFLFRDLSAREETVGHAIGEFTRELNRGADLLTLLPDHGSFHAARLLTSIEEESTGPITIIGGCASGRDYENPPVQFSEKGASSDAVSGLYLTGEFMHTSGICQTCHPVSGPLIVTKAEGNRVLELRGRPPMEHLAQIIKGPVSNVISHAVDFIKLGLTADPASTELRSGNYVVRPITEVSGTDGSLSTNEPILEGQPLSFVVVDPKKALAEFEEMVQALSFSLTERPPRFGFYFNSASRRELFARSMNKDIQIIRQYFPEMPLLGLSSVGELASIRGINTFHTLSGILTLVSDAEA